MLRKWTSERNAIGRVRVRVRVWDRVRVRVRVRVAIPPLGASNRPGLNSMCGPSSTSTAT
jgi:hypothetical protein